MIDKPNVEKSGITRRNFMNGFAMGLTAGTTLSPFELLAMNPPTSTDTLYPPKLIGMGVNEEDLIITTKMVKVLDAGWREATDIVYEKNGKVRFTGIGQFFFANGRLMYRNNYQNGKLHGPTEWFHDNGQLKIRYNCIHGEEVGPLEEYYRNGQLRFRADCIDWDLEGSWEEYYRNGQLKERYGEDSHEFFYDNGQLVKL